MAKRKTKQTTPIQTSIFDNISEETKSLIVGILLLTISFLVFFSTQETTSTGNAPLLGTYLKTAGIFLFWEYFHYIFSPVLALLWLFLIIRKTFWTPLKLIGIFAYYFSLVSIIGWYHQSTNTTYKAFFNIFPEAENIIGTANSLIFFFVIFFVSLYLIFQFSYKKIFIRAKENITHIAAAVRLPEIPITIDEEEEIKEKPILRNKKAELEAQLSKVQTTIQAKEKEENTIKIIPEIKTEQKDKKPFFPFTSGRDTTKINITDINGNIISKEPKKQINSFLGKWKLPSFELLNKPFKQNPISPEEIQEKALIIQKTLLQFGIEVEMEKECVGPTVIQYRLRPAEGVKVSKIENLNKDLALALSAKSIRIQAPIPGMNLVGIEVPNDKRDVVTIKEILSHKNFVNSHDPLTIALGKDINGDFIVANLAKMPHLLIAWQTGSWKSVGMNGIILSLLYKNSPENLQMIMVDPKQVELGMYDGIPHLLTPVITTPDKALNSLRWTVAEMERRYSMMRDNRTKNIIEYNDRVGEKEKIPYIVFIIDELADLMMSGNKKEVETQISRIAQKGRAAGMHIIIATQRPSVNVITGLIKANIPSRIAFTVTSQVDSRTILDQMGAESLLGRWDMLYWANGAMYPNRVQGMLVETDEIDNVVRDIRLTELPEDWSPNVPDMENIVSDSVEWTNWEGSIWWNFDEDPKIVEQAIQLVRDTGKCSTSMLQKWLRLGYQRSSRLVDILEDMWIVGPANGSKPRDVL